MDDEPQEETITDESSLEAEKSDAPSNVDLSGLQGFSIGPSWGDPNFNEPSQKQADFHPSRDRRKTSAARSPGRNRERSRERPGADRRSADRRAGGGPREDRRGGRGQRFEPRPPFKPIVEVNFYPDDAPFRALSQAMRHSCRTYELFELAHLILEKPERLVTVISPLADNSAGPREFYISVPDDLPFVSEEEAVNHVMNVYLENFFDLETVEVDPPKGVFKSVNRCTLTGELLGPPNYHLYSQIEQTHHATRLSKMSLERFRSKIETVTDPETIEQWLQKMRTQTRYVLKTKSRTEDDSPPPSFETPESARRYLLANAKKKIVTVSTTARFSGKLLTTLPPGSGIRQSVESYLEGQRRFPLDTANHLRGRLRRLHFSVYKKGFKGVSLVCAVKRKFRSADVTFADPVLELIEFIEKRPGLHVSKLAEAFFEPTVEEKTSTAKKSATKKPAAKSKEKPANIIDKDSPKFLEMGQNLRWLISEGYVVEYADGKLSAPPLQSPSRERIKKEPESEAGTGISSKIEKPAKKSKIKQSPEDPLPETSETEGKTSSAPVADPEDAEKPVPNEEGPTDIEPPPEAPAREVDSSEPGPEKGPDESNAEDAKVELAEDIPEPSSEEVSINETEIPDPSNPENLSTNEKEDV